MGVTELVSPNAERITASDGSSASIEDGALTLRNAAGQMLLRYEDGHAILHAPRGDLRLEAPHGRVTLRSGADIELEAARDLRLTGGRSVALGASDAEEVGLQLDGHKAVLQAPLVALVASDLGLRADRLRAVAERIEQRSEQLVQRAGRIEVEAKQLVERAQDVYRDVGDLLQTRAGRVRTVVREVFTLRSRRNVQISDEDTAIDGRRVLLG